MPQLERVFAGGKAFDTESSIGISDVMERMRVDTNERLHPAVDVALDDVHPGLVECA